MKKSPGIVFEWETAPLYTLYRTHSELSAEMEKFFDDNNIPYSLFFVDQSEIPQISVQGGWIPYVGKSGFEMFKRKFVSLQVEYPWIIGTQESLVRYIEENFLKPDLLSEEKKTLMEGLRIELKKAPSLSANVSSVPFVIHRSKTVFENWMANDNDIPENWLKKHFTLSFFSDNIFKRNPPWCTVCILSPWLRFASLPQIGIPDGDRSLFTEKTYSRFTRIHALLISEKGWELGRIFP